MTQLLVSVRSAAEAETALRGGAALIDVKEPNHGSLGRARAEVIAEIARVAAGRRPVSAALGELTDAPDVPREPLLSYVKWGLAGSPRGWQQLLHHALRRLSEQLPNCRAVAVAYADWRRAHAPTPEEVCSFAIENATGAFLIDTWEKDGSTLLDWLPVREVEHLQLRCRAAGVLIALAGSLGPDEIRTLRPLRPDWFAVRGAACLGRRREAVLDEGKVRHLAALADPSEPRP
jgi:uncharacterized protein (UPF0264 family)